MKEVVNMVMMKITNSNQDQKAVQKFPKNNWYPDHEKFARHILASKFFDPFKNFKVKICFLKNFSLRQLFKLIKIKYQYQRTLPCNIY